MRGHGWSMYLSLLYLALFVETVFDRPKQGWFQEKGVQIYLPSRKYDQFKAISGIIISLAYWEWIAKVNSQQFVTMFFIWCFV